MTTNNRIWKYSLIVTDIQTIITPKGSNILSVANQNGYIQLWALVDINNESEDRYIEIIGTGHAIKTEHNREFIGTVQINSLVWHIFERK